MVVATGLTFHGFRAACIRDALLRLFVSSREAEYHARVNEAKPRSGTMDERKEMELEAAVFRRLVAHLRQRTDVQNIDLMITAGFCRNCLGDWYREAAAEQGIEMSKEDARARVYGMPQAEWKQRYQKEATAEQQAAFERSQKTHS
jgi:uncharacterized protein